MLNGSLTGGPVGHVGAAMVGGDVMVGGSVGAEVVGEAVRAEVVGDVVGDAVGADMDGDPAGVEVGCREALAVFGPERSRNNSGFIGLSVFGSRNQARWLIKIMTETASRIYGCSTVKRARASWSWQCQCHACWRRSYAMAATVQLLRTS